MKEIYVSLRNNKQNREVIIEGDGHSVWAYVFVFNDEIASLEFDGFVCSRGTLVEHKDEVLRFIQNSISSPLLVKYSNEFSIQKAVTNDNISIDWEDNEIRIKLNGVEFLIMDVLNQVSYSKSVSEKGPYGSPIN